MYDLNQHLFIYYLFFISLCIRGKTPVYNKIYVLHNF